MLPQSSAHFFIYSAILTAVPRNPEGFLPGSKLRKAVIVSMLGAAVLLSAWLGAARAQPSTAGAADLVLSAIGLLGTPYRYGGDRPSSGFDCSGLVRYVAGNVLGVELPRRAEAISREGVAVSPRQLQPGDLVFFNTLGRPFSHVGFYVGDGQFIHAPARYGEVRIERLSQTYWRNRFDGARRLDVLLDPPGLLAADRGIAVEPRVVDGPYVSVEP